MTRVIFDESYPMSGTALRGLQPTLRTRLRPGHHQPALRRVARRLWLGKAHRGTAGPPHPPRAHPGDERRQLPPQGQPAECCRAGASVGPAGCRLAPCQGRPRPRSRRDPPPHRPGRDRQASPRWYSFAPPSMSTSLTRKHMKAQHKDQDRQCTSENESVQNQMLDTT